MGRGALAKVRWKNDRIRKKKERDKRRAAAGHKTPAAPSAPVEPAAAAAPAETAPAPTAPPVAAETTSSESATE